MADEQSGPAAQEPELKGIGGWLLLPPFHLVSDIVLFAWVVLQSMHAEAAVADAPAPSQNALLASVVVFLFAGMVALYALFCLVRLFQKKRGVPTLMIVFYALVIAKTLADLTALYAFPELVTQPDDLSSDWMAMARAAVSGVVWIMYFNASERVHNTFVR